MKILNEIYNREQDENSGEIGEVKVEIIRIVYPSKKPHPFFELRD